MNFLRKFYSAVVNTGNSLQSLLLLGIRLLWGWFFFTGGRDKFSDIESVAGFFHSLGIPFPELNAYIAASIECAGGLCLMLGLGARLVSLPLIVVMVVAAATAHHEAFANILSDPLPMTQESPFNFFFASLLIFVFGPGIFSVDALLKRIFFKNAE